MCKLPFVYGDTKAIRCTRRSWKQRSKKSEAWFSVDIFGLLSFFCGDIRDFYSCLYERLDGVQVHPTVIENFSVLVCQREDQMRHDQVLAAVCFFATEVIRELRQNQGQAMGCVARAGESAIDAVLNCREILRK